MITTNCPIPFSDSDCVLLAHGGGGRMTHQLISSIFYPAFRKSLLEQDHGAVSYTHLTLPTIRLV